MPRYALLLSATLALGPGVACAQGSAAPQTASQPAPEQASKPAPLLTPATPVNTMPRWSEFPTPPKTATPLSEFAARVRTLNQAGAQLTYEKSQIHWPTITPEDLHAQILAKIDPARMAPIDPPMTPQQIEAFAAKQRARAAPPPVTP